VALIYPSNHRNPLFRNRLFCIVSLLAISMAGLGCAGYTQQKTIPGLKVSTSSVDFQTVSVGQQSVKTLTVTNTGTASVKITAVNVTNKQFSVTGLLPQTLPPQSSATYTLTFAPTSAGSVNGLANISASTSQTPATVSLTGKGAASQTNLVINPSLVSFGNLALKSTSMQNVTLENTGNAAVTLQGVTVAGAGFGYSDLSPGFSIPPNQKLTFQVWFSPKVAGPAAATLTLMSANLSAPETLSMTGDGVTSSSNPSPVPPTPPATNHKVSLTWNASTSKVIGYRVYRSESSGGSYNALNGTAITALNYSDDSVASGTTYYYVVTSVDSSGAESVYSNQATAVIP
jgi:Abnormal spindle-like microcephaly-assoc'd, ASPM-SPD-2-Hydin